MSNTLSLYDQLKNLNEEKIKMQILENQLIEKSLSNPENAKDVVYATKLLQERQKGVKSFLLDPYNANNAGV